MHLSSPLTVRLVHSSSEDDPPSGFSLIHYEFPNEHLQKSKFLTSNITFVSKRFFSIDSQLHKKLLSFSKKFSIKTPTPQTMAKKEL